MSAPAPPAAVEAIWYGFCVEPDPVTVMFAPATILHEHRSPPHPLHL